MNANPLFSILIASYNNEEYIQETISSIIKQTYDNWEIIIVDDYSTDNSRAIYKELEDDPRIKIFLNNCNKGIGFTKKRCIDESTGDICAFVDPDDTIIDTALEIMVKEHIKQTEVGLIYSEAYYCDENLNVIEHLSFDRHRDIKAKSYLEEPDYVVGHFAAFKKTIYLKSAGLNESYKRAVDQDLYYVLEEVAGLSYINEYLYLYRIHTKGVSSVGINTFKAFSWHMAVIIDTCRRRNIEFETIITEKLLLHISNPSRAKQEEDKINSTLRVKIKTFFLKAIYLIKSKIK